MVRWLVPLLWCTLPALAGPAADVARALHESTFDRSECYRVRDLTLERPGIRTYLTDGYLMFTQPVAGRRMAAIFTTDVEGGDAEVIVMPPSKIERRSLASYIDSPTLDEHFREALFLGTSDLHREILEQMSANPTNRKVQAMGPLLDEKWAPVLRNLVSSYEPRLAMDLISGAPPEKCLLAGLFLGRKLGNFDVIFDPRFLEQVTVGQVTNRENRTYFDIWSSFAPRNLPRVTGMGGETVFSDYRIEASVAQNLSMSVVTRVKARTNVDGLRVLPMDIARNMQVDSVSVDGAPAEFLQREALRANLRNAANEMFLVAPGAPLRAGRDYEFEFHHHGNVIHDAGEGVYYVSARANWYPSNGAQFATFDLKFRYPRDLDMVSAGDVVEDSTAGEWRTTRRRTVVPVRMAGFNLGRYHRARVSKGGYVVEVYANRSLEEALAERFRAPVILPSLQPGRSRRTLGEGELTIQAPPPPNPAERLQLLASEVADALQFMAGKFGEPALPHLTISPIPGTFGQGFPGLIYLSTLSYLHDRAPAKPLAPTPRDLFFGDILQAHETAHQWWGNVVMGAGYHDNWLMEALANYSALLYLEKHRGARSLDETLQGYRNDLLLKGSSGLEVEAAGPIVLGTRLENSTEPRAWRSITYGKGSWIMHMLRRQMGDERFLAMLAGIRRQYQDKAITTEEFRLLAAKFLPPKSDDPQLEAFFDQWVYATGVPALKLAYSVKGTAPAWRVSGTITQSELAEPAGVLVPVEVQFARGRPIVHWVRTSNEPASFSVVVKQPPTRVVLDPQRSVLRR